MANPNELETYTHDTSCKKCGSELVVSEYNPHLELMKRTCSECGYSFFQLPLDRAKEMGKFKIA